jgi:hypothetical protein
MGEWIRKIYKGNKGETVEEEKNKGRKEIKKEKKDNDIINISLSCSIKELDSKYKFMYKQYACSVQSYYL